MNGKISKFLTPLKVGAIIGLAVLSFSGKADAGYVPEIIWVPAHCDHGTWREGYYLKILNPECLRCGDVVWVDSFYDHNGNWVEGHYQLKRYVIVNPGPDSAYPGYAM